MVIAVLSGITNTRQGQKGARKPSIRALYHVRLNSYNKTNAQTLNSLMLYRKRSPGHDIK
jgi:hypothetical protein